MRLFCLAILSSLGAVLFANPVGFEDQELLNRVLGGEVVLNDEVSTKQEFVTTAKAFFKNVEREAFYNLATDYPKYPEIADEVQSGQLVKVNTDKTEFDYKLDILVEFGLMSQHVYPEGHHTIVRAADPTQESKFLNKITNYQEYLKEATETTRLIPYNGGMLVEDRVHVLLQKESNSPYVEEVKNKLKEFFVKVVTNMRTILHGDPNGI